jgi:Protein of unknown function (DUF3303)
VAAVSAAKLKVAGDTPATTEATMLYMVIEYFKDAPAIYRRLRQKGRMMPDGLHYVSSWIDHDFKVCYQLMQTDDFALFERWTENWSDLMEFKITPVRTSAEAAELIQRQKSPNVP